MDEKGQGVILPVFGLALTAVIAFIVFMAAFNPILVVGQPYVNNASNGATINLLLNLIPLVLAAGILLTIWAYLQFDRQRLYPY